MLDIAMTDEQWMVEMAESKMEWVKGRMVTMEYNDWTQTDRNSEIVDYFGCKLDSLIGVVVLGNYFEMGLVDCQWLRNG